MSPAVAGRLKNPRECGAESPILHLSLVVSKSVVYSYYPNPNENPPLAPSSMRARFDATPVATISGGSAVSRPHSVVGRARSASAAARASGRRRRSAATRRSWSAAPTTARLATSSRSSHSSTRSSRTRPETRCGDWRSRPSVELRPRGEQKLCVTATVKASWLTTQCHQPRGTKTTSPGPLCASTK